VIDAPVLRPDPETQEAVSGGMFRAPKVYADLAAGLRHFHLVPPQPCDNGWLVAHIARHSLREVEGGVTWKFDPGVFLRRGGPDRPSDYGPLLARAACRVAVINGADSGIVSQDMRAYMAELLADSPAAVAGVPFVEVPEAQPHRARDGAAGRLRDVASGRRTTGRRDAAAGPAAGLSTTGCTAVRPTVALRACGVARDRRGDRGPCAG